MLVAAIARFPVSLLFGVGHRQPRAGDGAGMTAELGDHDVA
jgi:hypothetical protein